MDIICSTEINAKKEAKKKYEGHTILLMRSNFSFISIQK